VSDAVVSRADLIGVMLRAVLRQPERISASEVVLGMSSRA
jgi:hypothetical protein